MSWLPMVAAGLAAVGLAGGLAGEAPAQERLPIAGGFTPDPSEVSVSVTGALPAANAVRGCPGWIAEGPALVVDFSNPGTQLNFNAQADGTGAGIAGMLLVAPDGVYRCAPLDGRGLAQVRIDAPVSGQHAVWPALTAAGVATGVRILISEFDFTGPAAPAQPLGLDAAPAAGLHILPSAVEIALTLSPTAAAADFTSGCAGRIDPTRPDAVIRLEAPRDRVEWRATSGSDTTLVVVAPDGTQHCNDDTYGLDPAVVLEPAAAGDYAVWVGTYDDVRGVAANLRVATGSAGAASSALNASATPVAGLHVIAGEGAIEVPLTLAPTSAAAAVAPECSGQIDPARPDAVIRLDAPRGRLELRSTSFNDTTLLVLGPDGGRRCDDDTNGLDPAVVFQPAPAGDYAVWVGLYESGVQGITTSLHATASDGGFADGLQAGAAPAAGLHLLSGGGRVEVPLTLAPTASASEFDAQCSGRIDASRPDAVIRIDAGSSRLELRATSSTDTTLVVVGPDGRHFCNDDTDGLDPAVVVQPAAAGDYAVWVGTYEDVQGASATLTATGAGGAVETHPLAPGGTVEVLVGLGFGAAGSSFGPDCVGDISDPGPDAVIRLDSARDRLELRATSADEDTTLIVQAPDGTTHCDDDTFGLDPEVVVSPAPAGDYAVWVGSFGGTGTATLEATSGAGGGTAPTEVVPGGGGLHVLAAGGELEIAVVLGTGAHGSELGFDCWGDISGAGPDAVIRLEVGGGPLELAATSAEDTTLVVRGPGGVAHCNDDTNGLDPQIVIPSASAGDYEVWVGSFGSAGAAATLRVTAGAGGGGVTRTEVVPGGELHILAPGGELVIPVALASGASASDHGADCWGQINALGPDAIIRLEADRDAVYLSATSSADTTLVVLAPDGAAHCNDDTNGFDPAVVLQPAAAGDYAVWVGTFGGGEGGTATLTVSGQAGGSAVPGGAIPGGASGFGAMMQSPFEGRTFASAVEVLELLMQQEGVGEALSYQRVEAQGAEGFTLHGVTLTDPTGQTPPLGVGRVRVSDLDLAGLGTTGGPGRFAIALEDIDYAALAAAAGEAMVPLPPIAGTPALSITASLLPPAGDPGRRIMRAEVLLDGQLSLHMETRMRWHDGVGIPDDPTLIPAEALSVELRNHGFLGAVAAMQARQAGMEPAAFGGLMLNSLGALLAPAPPGGARAMLLDALTKAVDGGLERPGVLRMSVTSQSSRGLEEIFEELKEAAFDSDEVRVEVTFEPMP